jgi:hypothetical protein
MKPAALFRIHCEAKSSRRFLIRNAAEINVGDCDVDFVRIRRGSPLAAAEFAAFTGSSLPQDFASLIRVDGMDHSGLLADHQSTTAAAELHENWRLPEIEVGAVVFGAVRLRWSGAADIVGIALRELSRPEHLPGLQI